MSSVIFQNADTKKSVQQKRLLKKFILLIFQNEKKTLKSLTIIFCSDEYLLNLNKQFLKHDYYTDILTFDLSSDENMSAEIYISTERVEDNRKLHEVSFQNELLRIIFHGVLHLCGFSDKAEIEKKKMTTKENEYLKKYSSFHVKQ